MLTITNYSQIKIIPNSLVVFDIDDTIMHFPEMDKTWWKRRFDELFVLHQDYKKTDQYVLREWIHNAYNMDPQHIDEDEFFHLIDKLHANNCKIIFLTARGEQLRDITHEHFRKCNININNNDLYHNENKGDELKKIVFTRFPHIHDIIFIDDVKRNLDDVYNKLYQHKNLHLYHFHG